MYPGPIKTTGRNSKHENSYHTGPKNPLKIYLTNGFHGGNDLVNLLLLCYEVLPMMYIICISLCEV